MKSRIISIFLLILFLGGCGGSKDNFTSIHSKRAKTTISF